MQICGMFTCKRKCIYNVGTCIKGSYWIFKLYIYIALIKNVGLCHEFHKYTCQADAADACISNFHRVCLCSTIRLVRKEHEDGKSGVHATTRACKYLNDLVSRFFFFFFFFFFCYSYIIESTSEIPQSYFGAAAAIYYLPESWRRYKIIDKWTVLWCMGVACNLITYLD